MSFNNRLEPHFPQPRNAIVEDIYFGAEDRAVGTWPNITDYYKKWFSIGFSSSGATWSKVRSLMDARNAIAHGLGGLTRRQARKNLAALKTGLKSIDIDVKQDLLVLQGASVATASRTGRDFIYWLDQQLQAYDTSHP